MKDFPMQTNTDNAIETFDTYLKKLIEKEGTDLHIKSNSIVRARIKGLIMPLGAE